MLKPPANGPLSNKIFVKIGKVLQKQPWSSYCSAAREVSTEATQEVVLGLVTHRCVRNAPC